MNSLEVPFCVLHTSQAPRIGVGSTVLEAVETGILFLSPDEYRVELNDDYEVIRGQKGAAVFRTPAMIKLYSAGLPHISPSDFCQLRTQSIDGIKVIRDLMRHFQPKTAEEILSLNSTGKYFGLIVGRMDWEHSHGLKLPPLEKLKLPNRHWGIVIQGMCELVSKQYTSFHERAENIVLINNRLAEGRADPEFDRHFIDLPPTLTEAGL